ncbi:Met-10+ like-protein-domain-containing protein [Sporodiniella umbellata]|nr:Met-10+ like-protein-domain-containing protein [Sporodiniella umbellata]
MVVLNRDAFNKAVKTLAIKVPAKKVGVFTKAFSNNLFNQPRFKNVFPDPQDSQNKLILLRGDLEKTEELSEPEQELILKEGLGTVLYEVKVEYDYWNSDQIFRAVMPEEFLEFPSSFTQIGHIAHINLKEEYSPWKHLIGEVILDKNKSIRTVVNKTNNIDTTFRFFQMELLAGDDDMIAEMKESGCKFKFDFSKVYWNSRLHTEHDRLIQLFKPKESVCDVFAGVGPFAVPAAKKGSIVYANDLNPASFSWMKENIKANKILEGIHPYNMDGRAFIQQAVEDLQALTPKKWNTFDHFVMNLPATAIEFLDSFRGLYSNHQSLYDADAKLPYIHCHCFTKSTNPLQDISQRVGNVIGELPDPEKTTVHWVRNVAPKKEMYCISFPLSPSVAFETEKKRKLESEIHTECTLQKRKL